MPGLSKADYGLKPYSALPFLPITSSNRADEPEGAGQFADSKVNGGKPFDSAAAWSIHEPLLPAPTEKTPRGLCDDQNPGKMKKPKPVAARILKQKSVDRPAKAGRPKIPVRPVTGPFPVIAMATSVGGLEALSVILGGLPADFPAAIAIVMHLSPDHKSILAEILSRRTPLVVKEAHTGDKLCSAGVFVAPPDHHLSVAPDGRLKLSSSAAQKVHYARPSAEPLFASVAEVYRQRAIAVVLTGGDGDGSFGVQIVKDKGGVVIAQDRPTSQDFSMPETSINTGDVDFILPLDKISSKLIELVGAGKAPTKVGAKAKKAKASAFTRGV